jgi:tetratricopeptide (TPR) repeat protein
MDNAGGRSPRQLRRQVWLKWRLSPEQDVRDLAAEQLAEQPPPAPRDGRDPLLSGLTALAAGDFQTAHDVLETAALTGEHPECLVALADVAAYRGDWDRANDLATRAVDMNPQDPVAILGGAATVSDRSPLVALNLLEALRMARPDDQIVSYYVVRALLSRADQVAAANRDGRPAIISASQLDECKALVHRMAELGGGDDESAAVVAALSDEIRIAETPTWLRQGANWGTLVMFVLLAIAGILTGYYLSDVALLAGAVVFGLAVGALFVLTHRRPLWELRALDLGSVATRPDA